MNIGFWRNYLQPHSLAEEATPEVLAEMEAARKAAQAAKEKEVATARKMQTALQTIGKFVIKRKVGEEDKIFGSVTSQDFADAVYQQTSQTIDKKNIAVPTINTLGEFDVAVKLHAEVTARVKVVVMKE